MAMDILAKLQELLNVVKKATTAAGSKLTLFEGTDNGTSAVTLQAPASLSADCALELFDGNMTSIQYVDKIITTAEVLALNATPITVLPAVGAAVYVEFISALVFLDYNSAAYAADATEDLGITYLSGGAAVSKTIDGEEFEATADKLWVLKPSPSLMTDANAVADTALNAGFEVSVAVGEWITGDSPLKIRLFYRTYTAADLIAIA